MQAKTYKIVFDPEWHEAKVAGCIHPIQSAQLRKSCISTVTVLWCNLAALGKIAFFFLVV